MDIVKKLRASPRSRELSGPDGVTSIGFDEDAIRAEAADEIERLRAAFGAFSKALSAPGGPSLDVQRHDPSWEAWKRLCDAFAFEQHSTEAMHATKEG